VADYQFRGLTGKCLEDGTAGIRAQVISDADMHAAGAEMPIHDACQPVPGQQRLHVRQILRQILGSDGGVLPARPGLTSPSQPGRQPRAVLPHTPQRGAFSGVGHGAAVSQPPVQAQRGQQPVRFGSDGGRIVAVEVDVQPGFALRQAQHRILAAPETHGIHDGLVDALHGCR
jgi:hypothetical protein